MKEIRVLTFYKFTKFDQLSLIRGALTDICKRNGVLGIILIAKEGLNGTIAGKTNGINNVLGFLRSIPGCDDLEQKNSFCEKIPFKKLRVRLKKEIVTMGIDSIDPSQRVGRYVHPEDWNSLILKEDVVIIDTRNDYEVAIGTFEGSINPKTKRFRDFPDWWEENSEKLKGKKIAMFCTGGIRCEKSTNYLLQRGVPNVYHLKGGILKYLEKVEQVKSKWLGECFVFDQRVSVKHNLMVGSHRLCFACRRPISYEDENNKYFEEGVSCHHCYSQHSQKRKEGFRERQRQIRNKSLDFSTTK